MWDQHSYFESFILVLWQNISWCSDAQDIDTIGSNPRHSGHRCRYIRNILVAIRPSFYQVLTTLKMCGERSRLESENFYLQQILFLGTFLLYLYLSFCDGIWLPITPLRTSSYSCLCCRWEGINDTVAIKGPSRAIAVFIDQDPFFIEQLKWLIYSMRYTGNNMNQSKFLKLNSLTSRCFPSAHLWLWLCRCFSKYRYIGFL